MPRAIRENALCALIAALGCGLLAWLGLYGFAWTDYEVETRPAIGALLAGHLGQFLTLAPVYGGSLIERAPFALLGGLWGGGETATYRLLALPCLLASAVLAVWLVARMRAEGRSLLARAVTLGLCVANPLTLLALEVGHPEELLGGSLCVAAVLLAGAPTVSRRRAITAGALLGLAIANKQWAVLAAGAVLLALPPGRRWACLLAAAGVAALIEAPLFLLGGSAGYTAGANALASSSTTIFQPQQLWWFFGRHGALVHGTFGLAKPGYRVAPGWTAEISHPLALLAGIAIAAMLWRRTHGQRLTLRGALLMLGVTLLARCLLDTWDTSYYLLPAMLALLAWEANHPTRRPPLLTIAFTVAAWAQFHWLPARVSPDAQSAIFMAWSLPLLAALGARLLAEAPATAQPRSTGPLLPQRPRLGLRAQEMTVSSFESPVSTSRPPSRTTVRSSIRTPSTPGR